MHRAAIISSYVAHGAIGLRATSAAFPAEAFEITAIPTVVLSNQPGLKACAGTHVPPETLLAIFGALEANDWLKYLDAVFVGYMPTLAHVHAAEHFIVAAKSANPRALIVVDPILGDDPGGLYIPSDAAAGVRDRLVAKADVVTPNRFELAWMTGHEINDAASAADAARTLGRPIVVTTSIPAPDHRIANVLLTPDKAAIETVMRHDHAPHGTGDYFAGTLTAAMLNGEHPEQAVKSAAQRTARLLQNSIGKDHLSFAGPC